MPPDSNVTLRELTNESDPICNPDGSVLASGTIKFDLVGANGKEISLLDATSGELIYSGSSISSTITNGYFTNVSLWPNSRGEAPTHYKVTINNKHIKPFNILIEEGEGSIDILAAKSCYQTVTPEGVTIFGTLITTATGYVAAAEDAAAAASESAIAAAASASEASGSAAAAGVSESNAANSAFDAAASADLSEAARVLSVSAKDAAVVAKNAALVSETNAGISETNASTSEGLSADHKDAAGVYAAAAAVSAGDASDSADAAAASLTTTFHKNVTGEIQALDYKTTPVSNDYFLLEDSDDGYSKKRVALSVFPFTPTVIHGGTTPVAGTGIAKDFYFLTSLKHLYYKEDSTTWHQLNKEPQQIHLGIDGSTSTYLMDAGAGEPAGTIPLTFVEGNKIDLSIAAGKMTIAVIPGVETAGTTGSLIGGATEKAVPIDADSLGLSDSVASSAMKKLTWANVKAVLKTYFDTLYVSAIATYTATATGLTTSPTGTVSYAVANKTVTLNIPTITGTSNATTFTLTGGPSGMRPSAQRHCHVSVQNNSGAVILGDAVIETSGTISLYLDAAGTAFAATGTKAIYTSSVSYLL